MSTLPVNSNALNIANDFFAAIERCDIPRLREIYAPDVLIWANFDALEARNNHQLSQTVDANLALLATLPELIQNMRYKVWHEATTEKGFVRQHIVEGLSNGEPVAIPVCVVGEVTGDRISAFYEYMSITHLPAAILNYFAQQA